MILLTRSSLLSPGDRGVEPVTGPSPRGAGGLHHGTSSSGLLTRPGPTGGPGPRAAPQPPPPAGRGLRARGPRGPGTCLPSGSDRSPAYAPRSPAAAGGFRPSAAPRRVNAIFGQRFGAAVCTCRRPVSELLHKRPRVVHRRRGSVHREENVYVHTEIRRAARLRARLRARLLPNGREPEAEASSDPRVGLLYWGLRY